MIHTGNLTVTADTLAYAQTLTAVSGELHAGAPCSLPQLTSAHGQLGRLLAVSGYGLWLSAEGLYYAGCRGPWSKAEALAHWAKRTDGRAQVFTKATKETT